MLDKIITRVSLDSFKERSEGKKLVLLYPWHNYRQLFLTHFLADENNGLLYYCIPHDVETVSACMTDLVEQMSDVLDGFGKKLKKALPDGKPAALGKAFAADLGAVSSERVTLFIDELDRVPFSDEFDAFIRAAIKAMPAHAQLALSSRLLTRDPWQSFVTDGSAVVLGTEFRRNDIIFTVEEEAKPQVEAYAFGRGHAYVNGEEIVNWDGALPRHLFFYFMDSPLVTRDDIFATFWPNLTVKEATNVFHVTKRKISERITLKIEEGGEMNYELTRYASGFYMPSEKVVRHYDVEDFEEAIEQATTSDDEREREQLYRHAIDIYKAPFLETVKMAWVEERRDYLRQLYAQALVGMGRICKRRDAIDEALGHYTRAVKEAPEREDIHREIMNIYIEKGMPQDAKQQYDTMRKTLKEMLGINPSRDSQALYESIG